MGIFSLPLESFVSRSLVVTPSTKNKQETAHLYPWEESENVSGKNTKKDRTGAQITHYMIQRNIPLATTLPSSET